MLPISFMLANYAARPLGYRMGSWEQGERATSDYFKPIRTFAERFERYLADVRDLGFAAVDVWQPMLDPRWVTDEHIDVALELLDDYDLDVVSYAGWFGASPDDFEANCEVAAALGSPLLAGTTSVLETDLLHKYGLRFAYENEAERSAGEILAKIDADDALGVCADVGWFGTHGIDAAETLRELAPRLLHVHLKGVRQVGSHDACRFGEGIVPLERCVRVLQDVGYRGAISIEQETSPYDPGDDVRASLELLQAWLEG